MDTAVWGDRGKSWVAPVETDGLGKGEHTPTPQNPHPVMDRGEGLASSRVWLFALGGGVIQIPRRRRGEARQQRTVYLNQL